MHKLYTRGPKTLWVRQITLVARPATRVEVMGWGKVTDNICEGFSQNRSVFQWYAHIIMGMGIRQTVQQAVHLFAIVICNQIN